MKAGSSYPFKAKEKWMTKEESRSHELVGTNSDSPQQKTPRIKLSPTVINLNGKMYHITNSILVKLVPQK